MLSTYAEQTMVDLMPIAACVFIGAEHVINAVNKQMLAIWGKDITVMGKELYEAIPELSEQGFAELLTRVYNTGEEYRNPYGKATVLEKEQQRAKNFDFSLKPLRDRNGIIYGVVNTAVDTTERVLAEEDLQQANQELNASNEELRSTLEELRATNEHLEESRKTAVALRRAAEENESKLHNILDTMAEGLALFDANGKTYYLNQAAYRMLDLPQDSVRSRNYNDATWINLRSDGTVMPPEEHPMFMALKTGQAYTGQSISVQLRSGRKIDVVVNATALRDLRGHITGGIATFMDATEQLATNRRLQESEEQLQNTNMELTAINEEQAAVNEELRVAQQELLLSNHHLSENEEDMRLTLEAANLGTFSLDIASGEVTVNERCREMFGFERQDKLTAETIFSAVMPRYIVQVQQAMNDSIKYGMPCDVQYEVLQQHTRQPRWMRSVGRSYRADNGVATRFYGVVVDITGEKELEKRKDDFISIASHELKTPVTSLKAALQLMEKIKGQPDSPMMPKLLLQARRGVERVSVLIDDLLNVARLQQTELQLSKSTFIMSQLLNACANPIAISGSHKIQITGDLMLEVTADEHRIDQVVTNFLTNAVKYAPGSELIELTITQEQGYAKVSVIDKGPGIPQEKLKNLFDRYYRVSETGHHVSGLGLGLYISAEIIQRHGGEIGAESELGKGSTFWFSLPLM